MPHLAVSFNPHYSLLPIGWLREPVASPVASGSGWGLFIGSRGLLLHLVDAACGGELSCEAGPLLPGHTLCLDQRSVRLVCAGRLMIASWRARIACPLPARAGGWSGPIPARVVVPCCALYTPITPLYLGVKNVLTDHNYGLSE
jgi:hypothetical protein